MKRLGLDPREIRNLEGIRDRANLLPPDAQIRSQVCILKDRGPLAITATEGHRLALKLLGYLGQISLGRFRNYRYVKS